MLTSLQIIVLQLVASKLVASGPVRSLVGIMLQARSFAKAEITLHLFADTQGIQNPPDRAHDTLEAAPPVNTQDAPRSTQDHPGGTQKHPEPPRRHPG